MKPLVLFATALAAATLANTARAKPVSANITLQNDSQFACFIISADAENIRYSLDEAGTGVSVVPRSQVKSLITRPPEEWTEAEASYNSGDLEAAEAQFRKLAEDYAPIAALEDEYGSLSKYYYLQTLKRNGKLSLLADEIEKMRTQVIVLSKTYSENAKWLVPWGYIGKENWDALLTFVNSFVDTASQNDNTSPPFMKGIQKSRAAELSYFRAIATEKKEGPKAAVRDYYRAITLASGGDRQISRESVLALLRITKAAEDEAESFFNKSELHSLAILMKHTFGEGEIPPQFVAYLTPPPEPAGLTTAPEENPGAENPAGETPAAEAPPAEAPAPEAESPDAP